MVEMILGLGDCNCDENKNYERCWRADISILNRFCPICPDAADDFVCPPK